jgi:hypothetical protein
MSTVPSAPPMARSVKEYTVLAPYNPEQVRRRESADGPARRGRGSADQYPSPASPFWVADPPAAWSTPVMRSL